MILSAPEGALPQDPACPFCDGRDTELFNPFGSQLSVATYWCRACRSPFEFFKWGADEGVAEEPGPGVAEESGSQVAPSTVPTPERD